MNVTFPIRILLADDHHVVRLGLASLIDFESSIEIRGHPARLFA